MVIFCLISCFFILFLIYVYAENKMLITKFYKIKGVSDERLRIVQISDVHKKRCERLICRKVKSLSPDVIFLTGDMVSRNETDLSYLEWLTAELAKICPVYACPGNHELDMPAEIYKQYREILKKNGVVYLENECSEFQHGKVKIRIAGAVLKYGIYRNPYGGYSGLESYTSEELREALGEKEGFTVLLAHNPLCFEAYCGWGADVVFSGHVHGGAIRLPVIGGLLSPERRFFPKYSKGVYKKGSTVMVVSGGIGKLRVFNPPEIVCCDMRTCLHKCMRTSFQ